MDEFEDDEDFENAMKEEDDDDDFKNDENFDEEIGMIKMISKKR